MREILEMSVFKVLPIWRFCFILLWLLLWLWRDNWFSFHFSTKAPPHTVSHQYKFNKCNYKTFFKRHVLEKFVSSLGDIIYKAQKIEKLCSLSKRHFCLFSMYFRWNYLILSRQTHNMYRHSDVSSTGNLLWITQNNVNLL